jgi:hypothetical protein
MPQLRRVLRLNAKNLLHTAQPHYLLNVKGRGY